MIFEPQRHRDTETIEHVSTSTPYDQTDQLTERIIGFGIEVHRALGPGLLESAYEECLCFELREAGVAFERQRSLPITYKDVVLECGYRVDLIVENDVIVELKTVEKILPIHQAQLLTYLRLTRIQTGLLMNFNAAVLKDGIKRMKL